MESSNEFIDEVGTFKGTLAGAESEVKPARMVNHINFIGISQPEKLAEGLCPKCKTMLDLWISRHGLELSLSDNCYINKPAAKMEYCEKNPPGIREKKVPIIMDASIIAAESTNTKSSLCGALMDLLLKPISLPINLKKIVFYALLTFALIALLIQAVYYFWPAIWEPRIIALDTNWAAIMGTLILIIIGLAAVNYITYRFKSSDCGPNQIDRWTLASSIIIVDYYLLSRIALPLLLIYQLNLPL
ncbi:MAG: hypothetical protein ABFC94_17010 [Syntrophomonas sp.]